jgi:transposase
MLRPIDRTRRDGPLYPGSSRTLRDFIDPQHLLVRIDATFDFSALAQELERLYHPTTGRPPIHPEIVLRALLVRALYGIPSNRQLCERLRENLAWRWFCHLTLEDAVFDHSTLSVFLSRVGAAGLQGVLDRLNAGLAEAGLLSGRAYVDSSLIAADVSDVAGALPLLDRLPRSIARLTADSGYGAGKFRLALSRRGISSYIPLHPNQAGPPAGFTDHGDHVVCPEGKHLLPSGPPDGDDSVRYTARAADCQPCPMKDTCVQPSRSSKLLWASFYRITARAAARRNASATYEREQRRRQTTVEGIFAHLDHLGGTRACYRGLDRINAHGALTALAHNILKALTRRRFGRRGGPRLAPSGAVMLPGALVPTPGLVP